MVHPYTWPARMFPRLVGQVLSILQNLKIVHGKRIVLSKSKYHYPGARTVIRSRIDRRICKGKKQNPATGPKFHSQNHTFILISDRFLQKMADILFDNPFILIDLQRFINWSPWKKWSYGEK